MKFGLGLDLGWGFRLRLGLVVNLGWLSGMEVRLRVGSMLKLELRLKLISRWM